MIAGIKVEEEIIRDLERLDIELYVRGHHEAHSSPFSVHPGSTNMYHDLKQHFWWSGMKRDVAMFVLRCLICQQVKIEHQRASGLLQPLDIPVWKWDEISMDFVTRVIGWCVPDTPSHGADPFTHVIIRGLPSTAC
nr:retrotransposon protein, putative, Ty3-gypsy subclass [Tanacetum cinerariifolium]